MFDKHVEGLNANSGFYLLRASAGGLALSDRWLASIVENDPTLRDFAGHVGGGDQVHLNRVLLDLGGVPSPTNVSAFEVLQRPAAEGVRVSWRMLDRDLFANGWVYWSKNGWVKRAKAALVHNNGITGLDAKYGRLERNPELKFVDRLPTDAFTSVCVNPDRLPLHQYSPADAADTDTR